MLSKPVVNSQGLKQVSIYTLLKEYNDICIQNKAILKLLMLNSG